jgi:hypothetical protein
VGVAAAVDGVAAGGGLICYKGRRLLLPRSGILATMASRLAKRDGRPCYLGTPALLPAVAAVANGVAASGRRRC